jgi:hypothetical protein
MKALDPRLIAKGRSEPRAGLAQQGKVHVGLATHHAPELDGAGWSADDTAALQANVALLEGAVGIQSKAYDHASDTSTTESDAINNAKAFIRRFRNALPRALRESPGAGLTASSFHAGQTLERSTPKIAKYLAEIRPGVVTLDPVLAKHFKGQLASIELDMLKTALDQADTAQELARKHAPTETLALYEAMGQVLEQIEDLNRAGKIAFDSDPGTRAKFNKDVLQRARKERAKAKTAAPLAPPAPPSPPAATPPAK